jgi:hypothetical protein
VNEENVHRKGGGGGGSKGCKPHHVSVTNVTEILPDRYTLSLLVGITARVSVFTRVGHVNTHDMCHSFI